MSKEKEQISNLMAQFKKHNGGKQVKNKLSEEDAADIENELQSSFDSIFPELIKKEKQRKHVMFDPDIFDFFYTFSKEKEIPFSALINSALREFKDKKLEAVHSHRVIISNNIRLKEYVALKRREVELMEGLDDEELKEIVELDKKTVFSR